jgi:hypothetical protein
MGNYRFINLAVFIIFFGLSLVEAIQQQHWLLAAIFFAVGALALWADVQKKESSMRKNILVAIIALLVAGGVVWHKESLAPTPEAPAVEVSSSLEYRNTTYGFSVALPTSWAGYSVTIDRWTGDEAGDQLGDVHFTDGPVVSIHHPTWTVAGSYQDIPIMVFTLDQWTALQENKFHIGAAPIGPSELARNAYYVFALPARYNYSFPPGYEEVDRILLSKPISIF